MLEEHPDGFWRRVVPVIICVAIGLGLGVWHNAAVARGANDPVTKVLRTVLAPVVGAVDSTADWFSRTTTSLFRGRRLAAENARRRRRVAELTEEVNQLREAGARAERLAQYVPFLQTPPEKLPAPVIAIEPAPQYGTLLLGRGSLHGVRTGAVVTAPEGLVGHVYEVTPTTACVLLASDSRASVGAMVQRPDSRAVGICRGLGGRLLLCTYLTRDADVRVGDTIITSGLGGASGIYPKGIVIGTVTSVTVDMARSSKSATVRMAVDPARLEEVAVLK